MANAFAERWIATLRRELLDRTIIWNQRQLERIVIDYIDHYNAHRPHRSLNQRPPAPTQPPNANGQQASNCPNDTLRRPHQRIPTSRMTNHDRVSGTHRVPTIRSWALTSGFALHPGTRNRHEIRYTRIQHRPESRHVNDHGRVFDTHRPGAPASSTSPRSQLLDMVPGRTADGPARWLLRRPQSWLEQIRWAVLDLSGPYRAAL